MISKGDISANGINLGGALGGHGAVAGQPFQGDPFENGRLAARKLNFHGTGEKAAGDFTGGTRVANRRKEYRVWAQSLRNSLIVLRGSQNVADQHRGESSLGREYQYFLRSGNA